MNALSGISVCIWDFDGTLYKQHHALWENIRATEIAVIMEHTGWTEEKAKEEFYKIYPEVTPSGTKTTSMLAGISNAQASIESSRLTDYASYLREDPRLLSMFDQLTSYQHYMLVNGSKESVARGLMILGVPEHFFVEIVTSEVVGETKPGLKGFSYILQKTGLPPQRHVMIGDRERVDLVPAKSIGIKTCLAWADGESEIADVTIPTIYDIVRVLG